MDLEVDRTELRRTRLVPGRPLPDEPPAGTALFRVASFAVTANNVTYAVAGDLIGYWRFYPASDDGWGRVPVWGYADVEASACPGVVPDERYFGFWPMSTHAVLQPAAVGAGGFTDGAAHRADLPPIYNRYQRSAPAGEADADAEARTALWRPLFSTSFLIDAWLGDEDVFGAERIVLTSASSKTAIGLAHLLSASRRGEVVGLTSAGHAGFVAGLGVYDRVATYDELPAGLGDGPAVLVDMAGDGAVLSAVHGHLGHRLRRSVRVGITHHHDAASGDAALAGPAPEWFFAPDHIVRRTAEWGLDGFVSRLEAARASFDAGPGGRLVIDRRHGADAVAEAWREAVDGAADPARGVICAW